MKHPILLAIFFLGLGLGLGGGVVFFASRLVVNPPSEDSGSPAPEPRFNGVQGAVPATETSVKGPVPRKPVPKAAPAKVEDEAATKGPADPANLPTPLMDPRRGLTRVNAAILDANNAKDWQRLLGMLDLPDATNVVVMNLLTPPFLGDDGKLRPETLKALESRFGPESPWSEDAQVSVVRFAIRTPPVPGGPDNRVDLASLMAKSDLARVRAELATDLTMVDSGDWIDPLLQQLADDPDPAVAEQARKSIEARKALDRALPRK